MKSIDDYIKAEDWKSAQRLIRKELKACPESHWLWSTLSHTYYEQYQYKRALKYAKKALRMKPHCWLALWDYAGPLYMEGHDSEALAVWKSLVKRGVKGIANGECGEGVVAARQTVNDCLYNIGRFYAWLGKKALAVKYFRKHLKNRRKGFRSAYKLRDVENELASVESV